MEGGEQRWDFWVRIYIVRWPLSCVPQVWQEVVILHCAWRAYDEQLRINEHVRLSLRVTSGNPRFSHFWSILLAQHPFASFRSSSDDPTSLSNFFLHHHLIDVLLISELGQQLSRFRVQSKVGNCCLHQSHGICNYQPLDLLSSFLKSRLSSTPLGGYQNSHLCTQSSSSLLACSPQTAL